MRQTHIKQRTQKAESESQDTGIFVSFQLSLFFPWTLAERLFLLLAVSARTVNIDALHVLVITETVAASTRSSAIAEGPRDAPCQLKSCQLPRSSAETTCTTSPEPSISCR